MKSVTLKIPKEVLYAADMRAEPKVLLGILHVLADRRGIVETTTLELAGEAKTTQRSVEKCLERLAELQLIDRVQRASGWLLLHVVRRKELQQILVPTSVLAWPKLTAEAQLIFALLWNRRLVDQPQEIHHGDLTDQFGGRKTNAGKRWLDQLIKAGLLTLVARQGTPFGISTVQLNDPDRVREQYYQQLRNRYRSKTSA